jgi:hypothetical protein
MEMARDRVREVEEAWGVRGPVELTEPDRGREKVSK